MGDCHEHYEETTKKQSTSYLLVHTLPVSSSLVIFVTIQDICTEKIVQHELFYNSFDAKRYELLMPSRLQDILKFNSYNCLTL